MCSLITVFIDGTYQNDAGCNLNSSIETKILLLRIVVLEKITGKDQYLNRLFLAEQMETNIINL